MAQLKRYNGSSWEYVGGVVTGDTLPIGSEIEYNGASVPAGWQEIADYSTSEIDTGKKWIDGKTIYRKVIYQTMSGSTTISIQHDISNLGEITFLNYFLYASSNHNTDIPNNSNFDFRINRITSTTIQGISSSAYDNSWLLKIILEYTKIS